MLSFRHYWSIGILFFLVLSVYPKISLSAESDFRTSGTNTHYEQGDWITYTTTRFIRSIAIGHEYVYFATTGGITRYNYYRNEWDYPWTVSNGLADNNIFLVGKDFNTGYLWCTNENSISYQEPATQWWYNIYFDELGLRYGDSIASIGFANGLVYLETHSGNWLVSINTSIDFSFTNQPEQDQEIRWYGAREEKNIKIPYMFMSDGYLFDETNLYIDDLQFRKFEITTWARDEWQNLWIGTWGLGAGLGDMATFRLEMLGFGLWDKAVDAVARDGDAFWIGGIQNHDEPAGITEWPIPSGKPSYFEAYLLTGFDNDEITSLAIDEHTVWLGTHDGLTRYDREKNIWRTYTVVDNLVNNSVYDLLVDDEAIWVATEAGVSKVLKKTVGTDSMAIRHVLYPSLRNLQVYDLDQKENLLWIGTELGLFVYDKNKDEGHFYSSDVDPVDESIYALSVYKNELWYGTETGVAGFNTVTGDRFDPPAHLNEKDLGINKILATEDAVWVASNSGVLKYDRNNERWVFYTIKDGLASNNVYSLFLDGDYIWFGTDSGLTKFYWNSPYRID